jgi:hypothetical protein
LVHIENPDDIDQIGKEKTNIRQHLFSQNIILCDAPSKVNDRLDAYEFENYSVFLFCKSLCKVFRNIVVGVV